jgi:tight adherence protein B
MQPIALFFLATVAVGGVAWVFIYPLLSGERKAEQRMANVARAEPAARATRGEQRSRRDVIENILKEFEERHKKSKSIPLSARISLAGLTWSKNQFFMVSAALGAGLALLGALTGSGLLVAGLMALVGGFGLPRWMLSYLKKRREGKFLDAFPDAVDIIVRGVKAGLPLLDCLKMITLEAPEPVKSEFRAIVETQAIGMSIQQRAGGNLAEALGNLSRVLRDRKKMKAKIQAMSQEAKASAGIIGALPVAVMTLVYITSPNYISLLWTEPLGRLMLAACVVWMSLGVAVMKKMINFDF